MRRKAVWAACIAGVAALAVCYYRWDPAHSVWAPKCVFRLLTGYDCPACGSQRALHALLHGRLAAAFAANPFLVVSVPYVAAVFCVSFGRGERLGRWRGYVLHPLVLKLYVVLILAWWVLRNTPLWR